MNNLKEYRKKYYLNMKVIPIFDEKQQILSKTSQLEKS